MAITREQVEKVSMLGRLLLSEDELDTMTAQMGRILGYMDLLSEVDTEEVEPMAHPLDVSDIFRDDTVGESLPREQALANSPNADDACYLVPAVLGDL